MNAITVSNLRITPYSQKDTIAKIVYGDEWSISIKLPTPHVAGDKYAIGIDYQNTLYPPNRPLCAGSDLYVLNGDELTFTLKLATARLRDWCSTLKKPMPIAIQIVRTRDGKAETLLLDSLLALPSVFDGVVTVYEGDSLDERLNEKMDNPPTEGEAGQVLGINEDGQIVWTTIEIPEQEQADWDESDSEAKSYIRNKPVIPTVNDGKITINQGGIEKGTFTVNQSGDTVINLNDGAQSDWDESDSSDVSYIRNKPTLFSGDYNDLTNKPNLATVATSGSYNDLENKPVIVAPVNADWEESDSSDLAYIFNKPNLANVATTGSYNDLTDKPEIPEQEQADWEQSDSSAVDFIKNKPNLATVATSGIYNDLKYKPYTVDYLRIARRGTDSTVAINKSSASTPEWQLEYSFDQQTWMAYTWTGLTGETITLTTANRYLYLRGNAVNQSFSNYHMFVMTGNVRLSGDIMSLYGMDSTVPDDAFLNMFKDCTAITDASQLKIPFDGTKSALFGAMFQGCTNLTSVPVITANNGNFPMLFKDCSSVNSITVKFTEWKNSNQWLDGVSATGTFYCPAILDCSTRNVSHVPSGWTIVRTDGVQADWSESDTSDPSYILNKPTIPAAQVQADWDESDSSDVTFIKNKPALATVATSGSYNDLSNKPDFTNYFGFEATATNETIRLDKVGSPDAISLEYSTDKSTWTAYAWESNTGTTITLASIGDKVYFRGNNSTFSKSASDYYNFVIPSKVKAFGNIMTLLEKEGNKTDIPNYCFYSLFGYGTGNNNKITQAPELPAVTVRDYGYASMFKTCVYLTEAPKLPADNIGKYCYSEMFSNTSIKTPPELPATYLYEGCYKKMFAYCSSSLTQAPKLYGGMANNCYESMFEGCSSLVQAPTELPATSLAQECYKKMFAYCSSLVTAPKIKATSLASDCCFQMFISCSSLTEAPELPVTTLASSCYYGMFQNCTSLTKAPELPATTAVNSCYNTIVKGCSKVNYLKLNITSFTSMFDYNQMLNGTATYGVLEAPDALDASGFLPANWMKVPNANAPDNGTTSEVENASDATYCVCPSSKETGVLTVASALTLNAMPNASTEIAYAEVVLDIAAGATVTAGSNITFVDTLEAGKRNVCVVRWSGGLAKMYVTITEDLDASSSI